jgi:hypothetical protein
MTSLEVKKAMVSTFAVCELVHAGQERGGWGVPAMAVCEGADHTPGARR